MSPLNLPRSSFLVVPEPFNPRQLLPQIIQPEDPDQDLRDKLSRFLQWLADLQKSCPFTANLHTLRTGSDPTRRFDLLVRASTALEHVLAPEGSSGPEFDGINGFATVDWSHLETGGTLITAQFRNQPSLPGPRWGSWFRSEDPEDSCGDLWALWPRNETVYFLVADGLGSGDHALEASERLFRFLDTRFGETDNRLSPADLLESAHQDLTATRGVVAFLSCLPAKADQLEYCGVGNISALRLRSNSVSSLPSHNGTLGYSLPDLRNQTLPLSVDDHLLFHTDGINPPVSFHTEIKPVLDDPLQAAAHLLYRFQTGTDDALAACVNPDPGEAKPRHQP